MGLSELRADAKLNRERILRTDFSGLSPEDASAALKTELAENVWPWLSALLGAVDEEIMAELADQGEAIDELIDQSQNILHPELTGKIVGVFETGKIIALALDQLLDENPDLVDELTRKRLGEMTKGYMQVMEIVTLEVADATVELEPEDDEEQPSDEAAAPAPEAALAAVPEVAPLVEVADVAVAVAEPDISDAIGDALGDDDDDLDDDLDDLLEEAGAE